ncbi:gliding motility protein GldM [Marinifilum sp.]|uniref:type IX secretion system motor protein PorM/GldM n=1 Tax=Marinifilum sp. TaxID=2033137 RepID=UPI003BAB905F
MGATNCKETPRQRMIGMMYLFLTAMLAINVSDEVLDAFTIIDDGLNKTTTTFEEKNQITYNAFKTAYDVNPTKVQLSYDNSEKVRKSSNELFSMIDSLKHKIVKKADGDEYDPELKTIKKKDNLDIPAEVMIVGGHGKKLKETIVEYRELLLGLVNENDTALIHSIKSNLNTDKPSKSKKSDPNHSWESQQFSNTPLIGAVTLLSKIQSDIRNTEADIINYLFNQIEAESFKFNDLRAEVYAKSSYILKGDTYEAKVFLAAVDTTQDPTVIVNDYGRLSKFDDKGRGIYRVPANEVGVKKWAGLLTFQTPSGGTVERRFKSEYIVAEPNVVVSPTKMNVFYVGVDNPVSVSAPGFTSDRIKASISNGNGRLVKRSDDEYIAKPEIVGRTAKVLVEAKFDDEWRPLRTVDFRVKPIPDPVAKIADKNGGRIKKNLLLAQSGVDAVMDNFDFDLEFKITGFTVSTIQKGFTVDEESRSDTFTDEQMRLLRNLRRNNKVYIEDIRAVGPDGVTRNLPAIVFRIE